MNKQEQRIAIAEWMGIKDNGKRDGYYRYSDGKGHNYNDPSDFPNYSDDLNAIHEAEEKLKPGIICNDNFASKGEDWLWPKYVEVLAGLTVKGGSNIHTSASQRSEALCRTLWPERFEQKGTKHE